MIRPAKSIPALLIVLFFFTLPGADLCHAWPDPPPPSVSVSFKGIDRIHGTYSALSDHRYFGSAPFYPGVMELKLIHVKPDGSETVLAASNAGTVVPWAGAEFQSVGASFRFTEMKAGEEHKLVLRETWWDLIYNVVTEKFDLVPTTYDHGTQTFTKPQDQTLQGTLLYDETFSNLLDIQVGGASSADRLSVPAGITLTVQSTTVSTAQGRIGVGGTLKLNAVGFTGPVVIGEDNSAAKLDAVDTIFWSGVTTAGFERIALNRCYLASGGALGGEITAGANYPPKRIEIGDSLFRGQVEIAGGESYTVSGSEFHGGPVIVYAVSPGSIFQGNVLTCPLTFKSPDGSPVYPTVTGNSFLRGGIETVQGYNRIEPSGVVAMPGNYWGGWDGPRNQASGGGQGGWLDAFGEVLPGYINSAGFARTGKTRASSIGMPRPFPEVWVESWRAGQNSLMNSPYVRQGRKVLVSYDLRTTSDSFLGAIYWVTVGGRKIAPENGGFAPKRDFGPIDPTGLNLDRTLNFVLSEPEGSQSPMTVELWMDASAVTGYANPGGTANLHAFALDVTLPPGRNLRIGVIDVHLTLSGFTPPSPGKGSKGKIIQTLREQIPAMWPLKENEVDLVDLGGTPYGGGYAGGAPVALTTLGFMNNLSWHMASFLTEYNKTNPQGGPIDFVVAVLPVNALGGADGANLAGRRTAALVDEFSPKAAIHELGHCLGLYGGTEQYKLADGPDSLGNVIVNKKGARVQNLTAFHPELLPLGNGTTLPMRHFAWGNTADVFDIMGATNSQWIVESTFQSVRAALETLLGFKSPGPHPIRAKSPVISASPLPGYRRIFVRGVLEKAWVPDLGNYRYQFMEGSLTSRDVTGSATGTIDNIYWLDTYSLKAYDDGGSELSSAMLKHNDFDFPEAGYWVQSFDLPPGTTRYGIVYRVPLAGALPRTIFAVKAGAGVAAQLQGPAAGSTLGETLSLSWTGQGGGPAKPLQHQLFYSADGGAAWTPLGPSTTEESITLSTDFLSSGDQIAFKVVSSDGIGSASSQLAGLKVENRPPSVAITDPKPGDRSLPGTAWTLSAQAADLEDGVPGAVQWVSSRDGLLGTSPILSGVVLAEGDHTLIFSALDSGGLTASAQVNVSVGPMATVDLAVSEDALQITPLELDPAFARQNRLRIGSANHVSATVRNQGTDGSARLRLFVTAPGGVEMLLAEESFDWRAFESRSVAADYTPDLQGAYQIRAVIEPEEPGEADPSNNERTWTIGNQSPYAHGGRYTVQRDSQGTIRLRGVDPDGDPLVFTVVDLPAHGMLTGTGPDLVYASSGYTGTDLFTFKVGDGLAESATATIVLNVIEAEVLDDVIGPDLVVTSHGDGQHVTLPFVTLLGTASDAGRGGNGVHFVAVNGDLASGGETSGDGVANWSLVLQLVPGANVLTLIAYDCSPHQNMTTSTLTLYYDPPDTTGPSLAITSPYDYQHVLTGSVSVAGLATDSGNGNSGISRVEVNGVRAAGDTASGSGTAFWSGTVALGYGANTLTVVAWDDSPNKNPTTQSITIYCDAPADGMGPVLAVTSHVDGQHVGGSNIVLAGTATDAGRGGSGIQGVTVNGVAASGGTAVGDGIAGWSAALLLTPGANVITIVAFDDSPSHNPTALTMTIHYDDAIGFVTSPDSLTLAEGGTASFQVRLSRQPLSTVKAVVSRVSGDSRITIQSGAKLTFTPSNWDVPQTVWLASTADADITDDTSTFRISAKGLVSREVSVFEVDPQAAVARLPRTGQGVSFHGGDDGEIEAGVAWPVQRFSSQGGGLVKDLLTGLVWAGDAGSPAFGPCPGGLGTWQEALDYRACMNVHQYLGVGDWRLPNVNELESLVHAGVADSGPWLESQGFTSLQPGGYWSSTTDAANPDRARTVDLRGGGVSTAAKAGDVSHVWLVRGETADPAKVWKTGETVSRAAGDDGDLRTGVGWPDPRFIAGAGAAADCVTDRLTGLTWLRNVVDGPKTWLEALDGVSLLSSCGHGDWRLPNRKELWSLIHNGQADPVSWLSGQGFDGLPNDPVWSSTAVAPAGEKAWMVSLKTGEVAAAPVTGSYHFMAVREGDFLTVSPAAGAAGMELTIWGSGFGALPGKVLIGGAAVKINEWTEGMIRCGVTKSLPAGQYRVEIQRKDPKGLPSLTLDKGFAMMAPEVSSPPGVEQAGSGTRLTIEGDYFGIKKGKVFLDGKTCKVGSWTMNPADGRSAATCTVSGTLTKGAHHLTVVSGAGSGEADFTE